MPADGVPNGIKIEWNMQQNGIPVVNRVYVTQTTAPTQADLISTIGIAKGFYDDFKTRQHSSCVLQDITCTDVSVANGAQEIQPYSTGNVGTSSGQALPANTALCASLRTAQTGRSFRGRFYLGGIATDYLLDAQHLTTTIASDLGGWMVDFIVALQTAGKTLVVVSRYANKVLRVVALATEIISVLVDNKIDSQRRRTAN
jgi:hypothetical protein